MEYRIIKVVSLERKIPTGKTKHFEGGIELPAATMLQITQYPGDSGFYLFYLNGQGEVMTDTYHTTIEGAFEQASWEYNVDPAEWIDQTD